jgi:Acyl-CoA dehydrogenase, C-terminal domain./Acyl-CoA dehydrogenase, middle domain./Acyl-CoA dehydrogenase, N-terminal domain.
MFKERVREFAEREVAPFVGKMEEGQFPTELVKRMGELGLMGIPIPKEYGGGGRDFTSYIIAVHEISRVSAALGVILSVHTSVAALPILQFGTEEQKRTFLPALAGGRALGAFCLTEENSGSDAASLRTRAEKRNGEYVINGSKVFITNGGEADIYIVFATIDPSLGTRGITAFLVEKGIPGFSAGKEEKKMGLNGSRTVRLSFDHVRVPESRRLGKDGQGFKIAMANLDTGRIGIAAQALGIAEAAFSESVKYAKGCHPSGKPMIENEGIAFQLADMATKIEAAKLLVYRAASLKDRGISCGMEASMAKMFSSDTAMDAAIRAVQIFGSRGYTKDFPVERFFRDAKVTQIYEGTNEIQRLVIGRHLQNRNVRFRM